MQFDMQVTCMALYEVFDPVEAECGTVGCALGHGPDATGIPGKRREPWSIYSGRVFGIYRKTDEYAFLFAAGWAYTEPSPEQAADRIAWLLDGGEPYHPLEAEQLNSRPWHGHFRRSGRVTWQDILAGKESPLSERVTALAT